MIIKSLVAYKTLNSRAEETIAVKVKSKNDVVGFGSAPSGASTGKHEVPAFAKNIDFAISYFNKSKKFSGLSFSKFEDLKKLKKFSIIKQIGGNPNLALEYAILNCIAAEKKQPLYKVINPNAKTKTPVSFGNAIGGGAHAGPKAGDIQEIGFCSNDFFMNAKLYHKTKKILEEKDNNFIGGKTDEGAWASTLPAIECLRIAKQVAGKKAKLGIDLAASELYKTGKYCWKKYSAEKENLKLTRQEQIELVKTIAERFDIFYIEDPLEENDFLGFAELRKALPGRYICGDDLTTTNVSRLKKAIIKKSVNAVIVKPNQIGSLIETKEFFDLAIKNNIMPFISHRSGETTGTELAHIALAWRAPYIKCGIATGERIAKLNEFILEQ